MLSGTLQVEVYIPSHNENLKNDYKKDKAAHRKLVRKNNAAQSIKRDRNLCDILEKNPSKTFQVIRSAKNINSRKISKLHVSSKTYEGDAVQDGFYDSILDLKTIKESDIQCPAAFDRHTEDYNHILKLCELGLLIPNISFEKSSEILMKIRSGVSDMYSVTSNQFLNAGDIGMEHEKYYK